MQTKQSVLILRPESVTKILSAFAIFFMLANIFFNYVKYITGDRIFHGLIPLFQLNAENNIPTFFSGSLFLFSAVLLIVIWNVKRMNVKPQIIWVLLAGLFLFLAFDEFFKVHGLLFGQIRKTIRTLGFPRFTWVIAYSTGFVLLSFLFFPVWQRLNTKVKLWFALSAVTFFSGAILFDIIGIIYLKMNGWHKDLIYGVLDTLEESLEMAGLIIFVYSLLLLIQMEFHGGTTSISDNNK